MSTKQYEWAAEGGAELAEHSGRKHKILREYVRRYLLERCKNPVARGLKLLLVDGFAGGGVYSDGAPGSPVILLRTLYETAAEINARRVEGGHPTLAIKCTLLLNDIDVDAVALLRQRMVDAQRGLPDDAGVTLEVAYRTVPFETLAPDIERMVKDGKFSNVLLNLDQCAYNAVHRATLARLIQMTRSVEILYTVGIQTLISFLSINDPKRVAQALRFLDLDPAKQIIGPETIARTQFLGTMERLVFETLEGCAPFVSPFSIHNPKGWRYWLIHMASVDRARQVYNDVLHDNCSQQAHYGRAGLRMLQFDPSHGENGLYLFDQSAREEARNQLPEDLARLIRGYDHEQIGVGVLWRDVYKQTPAHSDDIHAAMMLHPDVQVFTPRGGERRAATSIHRDDVVRLVPQRRFHFG